MAKIEIDQVLEELGKFKKENPNILSPAIYSKSVTIDQYCNTITKVNGEFPSFSSLMSHVVQGFSSKWTEMGEIQFAAKMLQAYKQKVNFGFVPSDMIGGWLAKMNEEGKDLKDKSISKYIMDEISKKIISDLQILSLKGVRDDNNNVKVFGKSLNGMATAVKNARENTEYPAFSIPLEPISKVNAVDVFEAFEEGLPAEALDGLKIVFCSIKAARYYKQDYKSRYGNNPTFKDGDLMVTPLYDLKIVPLNIPDDIIFTTPEWNMKKLIDLISKPEITDIQKQDYELKLFFEFTLNYDLAINQVCFVGNFDADSVRGLNNKEQNELFFPEEEGLILKTP